MLNHKGVTFLDFTLIEDTKILQISGNEKLLMQMYVIFVTGNVILIENIIKESGNLRKMCTY